MHQRRLGLPAVLSHRLVLAKFHALPIFEKLLSLLVSLGSNFVRKLCSCFLVLPSLRQVFIPSSLRGGCCLNPLILILLFLLKELGLLLVHDLLPPF